MFKPSLLLAASLLVLAPVAQAQTASQPAPQVAAAPVAPLVVEQTRVEAHQAFLAGDALRGRGSATPDEAVAAAYVAARFQEYGLTPAPGMTGFLQTAGVVQRPPSQPGRRPRYDVVAPEGAERITTNAIGWLQGSDPSAGVIMISAHLDHLGVRDGVIMHGANDDASGVTAVLELARTLAGGEQPKRSILFVAYGSEELGLLGSLWFAKNPPVPISSIVANLEIEMIGDQDPNMPAGIMMMTGFERSNFGPSLKERGALIAPDIYPDEHFFERSDNYQLALQGVVAHTISGWATIPSYHSADDTNENIDFPFMTQAIQSLVEPIRWLATSDFKPDWVEGGRPVPRQPAAH